jgi:hypothetical protein
MGNIVRFQVDKMYKNIYKDPNVAFIVDEILSQDKDGSSLIVTWYKNTDGGRYVSIGVNGDFYISKDQSMYYMEI